MHEDTYTTQGENRGNKTHIIKKFTFRLTYSVHLIETKTKETFAISDTTFLKQKHIITYIIVITCKQLLILNILY